MKKIVGIGLGVVFLLLGTLLVLPSFIDLGPFRQTYLPLIEETIQRRVDVGVVRLSFLPTPSIQLSSLKISASPDSPENVFFAAEQVALRVKFWPLIRGRFEATEFVLDKPVMTLTKPTNGSTSDAAITDRSSALKQRTEEKKNPGAPRPQEPASSFSLPNRMRIKAGQLNFETKGQQPLSIKGIDLSMQDFTGSEPFPYHASFTYPGLKSVALEGWLSYQEEQATLQLRDNRLKVQDLNLKLHGSVTHLSTTPRLRLSLASERADAKSIYQILSVLGLAPRDAEISGPMTLSLAISGPTGNLETQFRGQMGAVKVRASRSIKGHMTGEVFLKLPLGGGAWRRLQGDGKLIARDGEITNMNLVKRIQRVAGMIGLAKEQRREVIKFRTLETAFIIGRGRAEFKRVYLVNSQIEVHGAGTMTLDSPVLNLTVETILSSQASARAGKSKLTSAFKDSRGRIVVPLKITGSLENPTFELDGEKMQKRGISEKTQRGLIAFFEQLLRQR
jgi:uncharacterized protein involved in outer membrane biogenesis